MELRGAPIDRCAYSWEAHWAGVHDEKAVPYYAQTAEFTCGPACVLMTLGALGKQPWPPTREDEFRVWRRTNHIGVGGTEAYGQALPFIDAGLEVRLIVEDGPMFDVERLKTWVPEEDAVLTLWSAEAAKAEVERLGAPVEKRPPTVDDVEQGLADGWVPNCLVGMQEVHGEEVPHWVVATAASDEGITFNDPYRPKGNEGLTRSRERFQSMLNDISASRMMRGVVFVRGA